MSVHAKSGLSVLTRGSGEDGSNLAGGLGAGLVVLLFLLVLPAASVAQTAELLLRSNVPNAAVSVDGRVVGATGPDGDVLLDNLASGRRTVRVRKEGFWTASTRVMLEPSLTNVVSLELTARETEAADLLVETNVPGAQVRLDGTQRAETGPDGRATLSNVAPGRHRLAVRKEGYASTARSVSVSRSVSNQTVRVRLERESPDGPEPSARAEGDTSRPAPAVLPDSLRPDSAALDTVAAPDVAGVPPRLVLSANVEGARVYVNGTYRGTTPRSGELEVEADTGQYRVLLQKEGASSRQKTGRLAVGETRTLSFTLRREEPASVVAFVQDRFLLILGLGIGVLLLGGLIVALRVGWRRQGAASSGQSIDRYRMVEPIGVEDITTLYLAEDLVEDRYVVLKLLDEAYETDSAIVEAFLKQGEALRHIAGSVPEAPVVTVFRYGREEEWDRKRAFIEQEYVQGERLSTYLENHDLGVREALTVVGQVCTGLQAAHDRQLWHGQLTPEHVIVTGTTPEIRVKLVNFQVGAAHRAHSETTRRTPDEPSAYTAPEQCRGEGIDARSDVYAAGILFCTMMTGRPEADEQVPHENDAQEAASPPPLAGVPSHVESLIHRMLDPDPDNRPAASRAANMIDLVRETT